MSGYINIKYFRESFNAWVGEAQTLMSTSAAGASRRSELLGSAASGVRSLFSRETLMSAPGIPQPSLAGATVMTGCAVAGLVGAFRLLKKGKSSAADKQSSRLGYYLMPLALSGLLLLQHLKPFGLNTGGTAFAGGFARGIGVGFGFYMVSLGVKYVLNKMKSEPESEGVRERLTYVIDAQFLACMYANKLNAFAIASFAGVASIALNGQLLGYLSSKMSYGYPLSIIASIFSCLYLLSYDDDGSALKSTVDKIALIVSSFVGFALMGISYRISGNLLAPIIYNFLKLVDFYVSLGLKEQKNK